MKNLFFWCTIYSNAKTCNIWSYLAVNSIFILILSSVHVHCSQNSFSKCSHVCVTLKFFFQSKQQHRWGQKKCRICTTQYGCHSHTKYACSFGHKPKYIWDCWIALRPQIQQKNKECLKNNLPNWERRKMVVRDKSSYNRKPRLYYLNQNISNHENWIRKSMSANALISWEETSCFARRYTFFS